MKNLMNNLWEEKFKKIFGGGKSDTITVEVNDWKGAEFLGTMMKGGDGDQLTPEQEAELDRGIKAFMDNEEPDFMDNLGAL